MKLKIHPYLKYLEETEILKPEDIALLQKCHNYSMRFCSDIGKTNEFGLKIVGVEAHLWEKYQHNYVRYVVECTCGAIFITRRSTFEQIQTCGCYISQKSLKEKQKYIGQVYNTWKIVDIDYNSKWKRFYFVGECQKCGKRVSRLLYNLKQYNCRCTYVGSYIPDQNEKYVGQIINGFKVIKVYYDESRHLTNRTRFVAICPMCGGYYDATIGTLKQAKSCGCKKEQDRLENMKQYLHKQWGCYYVYDYTYDNKYKRGKLKCKCTCGVETTLIPSKLINAPQECPHTVHIRRGLKSLLQKCEQCNTSLISEYHGNRSLITLKCKLCEHEYDVFYGQCNSSWLWCPKCYEKECYHSNSEKIISKILQDLNIKWRKMKIKDSENNSKYEIDLYIDDYQLGIECNGVTSHASAPQIWVFKPKPRKYHLNKLLTAKKHGIDLLQFWAFEIFNKTDVVRSIIEHKLGLSKYREYARNCYIDDVTVFEFAEFLEENHIQGYAAGSKVRLGLRYKKNDALVAIMSFSKPRYSSHEWELHRFCVHRDCHVIGAASKLFKAFLKMYNPSNIISYCDRRLFENSKLYEMLGFRLSHYSQPNYFYFKVHTHEDRIVLESRVKYQKHKLKEILENFDPNKTEQQNMIDNGYGIVYDCGQKVYVWSREH